MTHSVSDQSDYAIVDGMLRMVGGADIMARILAVTEGRAKTALPDAPGEPARAVGAMRVTRHLSIVDVSEAGAAFDQIVAAPAEKSRLQMRLARWDQELTDALAALEPAKRGFLTLRDDEGELVATIAIQRVQAAEGDGDYLLLATEPAAWTSAVEQAFATLGLTYSEIRVVRELRSGESLPVLSARLNLSENTVRSHTKSAFAKLGVSRQAGLIQFREDVLRLAGSKAPVAVKTPAVRALREPRAWPSRTVRTLRNGRRIAYREFGPADGVPVLVCHGTITGSAIPEGYNPSAASCGVRLIAPDRPGYGWSDPSKGVASVQEAAAEMRELADMLGLPRYGVISIGAACAFALELCRDNAKAAVLVLVSPSFGPAGLGAQDRQGLRQVARQFRRTAAWLTDGALRALFDTITYERALQLLKGGMPWSAPDMELLRHAGMYEYLAEITMDARQHPVDGPFFDWRVLEQYQLDLSGIDTRMLSVVRWFETFFAEALRGLGSSGFDPMRRAVGAASGDWRW